MTEATSPGTSKLNTPHEYHIGGTEISEKEETPKSESLLGHLVSVSKQWFKCECKEKYERIVEWHDLIKTL